jgi:hypothetical protein
MRKSVKDGINHRYGLNFPFLRCIGVSISIFTTQVFPSILQVFVVNLGLEYQLVYIDQLHSISSVV